MMETPATVCTSTRACQVMVWFSRRCSGAMTGTSLGLHPVNINACPRVKDRTRFSSTECHSKLCRTQHRIVQKRVCELEEKQWRTDRDESGSESMTEYVAPAPAVYYATPAPPIEFATPSPVIEYSAPAPPVTCFTPSPQFPNTELCKKRVCELEEKQWRTDWDESGSESMTEYVAPAPAVYYATPAPLIEFVTPSPVIEYSALAPSVTCFTPQSTVASRLHHGSCHHWCHR